MSEEKKLSKDVLSRWLDNLRDFAIRMLEEHPTKEDELWSKGDAEAVEQIKSLIESSTQESSEAEVDELVERWRLKFPVACAVDFKLNQKNIKQMLKEYDKLRRG